MAAQLYQMFFFEHILSRISVSKYKDNLILKGGVLLASIIGEDMRTTRDMDVTLKSIPLEKENLYTIFDEIFSIDISDDVIFKIVAVKDIRSESEYGGFKINVLGTFDNIKVNFFIELTTGDVITPKEIVYNYNSIFENQKISVMAYTIETVIAEKFESIISKNIINTRFKDYYDLYMLLDKGYYKINKPLLTKAIKNTFKKRNTNFSISSLKEVFELIKNDSNLKKGYAIYQNKTVYVEKNDFLDIISVIKKIIDIIEKELEKF